MRITQFYTDLYMKRNWKYLHYYLEPQDTVFMGDLLDGGREWDDAKYIIAYLSFSVDH